MTLTEFLNARFDEDEAVALDAMGGPWEVRGRSVYQADGAPSLNPVAADAWDYAPHIARHSPARVLREVEAKRKILDMASEASGLDQQVDMEFRAGPRDMDAEPFLGDLLRRALALPYRDQPDYQQEWGVIPEPE